MNKRLMEATMFCPKCGKELSDQTMFCVACGEPTINNQNQQVKRTTKFYEKTWFIWVMLIFIAPVGIYLIWKQNKYNKPVRVILSITFGLIFLVAIMPKGGSEKNPSTAPDAAAVSESDADSVPISDTVIAKFEPELTPTINGNKVNVSCDLDAPDGTVLQFSLISGDLKTILTETAEVKNKSCAVIFDLSDSEPVELALMAMLQFNAETIIQPEATKQFFGERGEKLEGDNVSEAFFQDGKNGKNANYIMSFDYPDAEAVQDQRKKQYDEIIDELITTGGGIIVSVEPMEKDDYSIIYVTVSDAWYNSQEYEKERFVETVADLIKTAVNNANLSDSTSVFFYDTYSKKVAEPKVLGGYKILK